MFVFVFSTQPWERKLVGTRRSSPPSETCIQNAKATLILTITILPVEQQPHNDQNTINTTTTVTTTTSRITNIETNRRGTILPEPPFLLFSKYDRLPYDHSESKYANAAHSLNALTAYFTCSPIFIHFIHSFIHPSIHPSIH